MQPIITISQNPDGSFKLDAAMPPPAALNILNIISEQLRVEIVRAAIEGPRRVQVFGTAPPAPKNGV